MNLLNFPECMATLIPIQVGGGAAINGINISLKNAQRALILVEVQQGNAAQEVCVLAQSSGGAGSAAGTGEKVMTAVVPIFTLQDAALANIGWTEETAAKGFTFSAVTPKTKYALFVIDPASCMDVAGGFDCIVVNFSSNVNAATYVAAKAFIEPRYSPVPTLYSD